MSVTSAALDRLEQQLGELIAAGEAERVDFSEYADDPVRFMREVLDFHPWEKQVEVCQSVLENKRTVVRGHHGAGKDEILAALLLWSCYARRMMCLAVSATERQLIGQLWAKLARMWKTARLPGELYVGELRIGGEKRIVAMTSGNVSNLTGWHSHAGTGVFVAISESQAEQIGAVAFDAAEGNTVSEGSRIVVVGNPVKAAGRFFEVSRKSTWKAIRISAFDHPNIATGAVVIPGGPAPGWPAEMAAEYGEDSGFYVSRVLGEFPAEGSVDGLIRPGWLEAAFVRHEAGVVLQRYPLPVLALDVARSLDRDESVAAVAQGSVVLRIHAWRSRDLVDTATRFLMVTDRLRTEWYANGRPVGETETSRDPDKLALWLQLTGVPDFPMHVDSPGVGGGVVDTMRSRGRHVHEYWGWNPARDEKRFANRRAEIYWSLRTGLEAGTVALPRDPALSEEVLAMEWSLDAKGRILMIAKEDLRKALGRSPDRGDAVTMALAASSGRLTGPTVSFYSVDV